MIIERITCGLDSQRKNLRHEANNLWENGGGTIAALVINFLPCNNRWITLLDRSFSSTDLVADPIYPGSPLPPAGFDWLSPIRAH